MKTLSRKMILIYLSILIFFAFVGSGYLNFLIEKESIRDEIVNSSLPLTRENIFSEIMKDLIPPINISSMMANDSFLINWTLEGEKNLEEIEQYLEEIRNRYGYFSSFFVSEKTLNYYYYDGILKKISSEDPHDIWYYQFLDSGKKYDLDVDFNQAKSDDLTIFINYRLNDYNGNLLGVVGVGLEMEKFSKFLAEKQEEYGRKIYLVDSEGVVQAHSDSSIIEKNSLRDKPGLAGTVDKILTKSTDSFSGNYTEKEGLIFFTSRYMSEIDWFLVVEESENRALSLAKRIFIRTIIAGLLTTGIMILTVVLVIRRFEGELSYQAVTDSLTGLSNRRNFDNQVEKSMVRFERYRLPFCLIMIDIDYFKRINDAIGHLTGDKVLIETAGILKKVTRPSDVVCRWGGDEFAVIAECSENDALKTAERIREAVFNADYSRFSPMLKNCNITVSCGISSFRSGMNIEKLTANTDMALYRSKERGRNTVSLFEG